MNRPFRQVDVFGRSPYTGNPVAVVLDAEGLSTEDMRRFSVWSHLSECTFVLPPTDPAADYLVRIFSLDEELPFAGHPTLGTARAWLDAGGVPAATDIIVQECAAGLIDVRRDSELLSFAAPARLRSGTVEADYLATVIDILGLEPESVVDAAWVDNGPPWVGLLLGSDTEVLALRPDAGGRPGPLSIGVVGPTGPSNDARFEVRAFFSRGDGDLREDPVTGSLNASLAQWLLETGRATAPYVARQGTVLGRDGRVHISADDRGVWVGGRTHVALSGTVDLG